MQLPCWSSIGEHAGGEFGRVIQHLTSCSYLALLGIGLTPSTGCHGWMQYVLVVSWRVMCQAFAFAFLFFIDIFSFSLLYEPHS
jgi:hypothetical protein